MTIEDIKKMTKEILTPVEVAQILQCDAELIRFQARKDISSLGFPVSVMGSRIKIPRRAFIKWIEGDH